MNRFKIPSYLAHKCILKRDELGYLGAKGFRVCQTSERIIGRPKVRHEIYS